MDARSDAARITTSAWVRSHGRFRPPAFGTFWFRPTRSSVAYDADLHGEGVSFTGTWAEASKAALAHYPTGLIAVLP